MTDKKISTVSLIGFGAMGSFFAPRLSAALGGGFRLTAGGERKKRLETKGVTINGVNYRLPVDAPDDAGRPADLVIIATKGYSLEEAVHDIRGRVGPDTLILSVMNGVDSERRLIEAYGREHVLYSYMRMSIVMKDGVTDFDPTAGKVHFGEEKNAPGEYSRRVLRVKELFDSCGIPYEIDPDMVYGIWLKFACNVGENLTCAMLRVPFGIFRVSEDANIMRRSGMREVQAVAAAEGITIREEDILKQDAAVRALPVGNKPSTLQDIEAGRRTEVDMFAGTVIRLGKKHGIPTPVCEMFYHGVRALEAKNASDIF
jgi:2-dehydropantoate 2-reductase